MCNNGSQLIGWRKSFEPHPQPIRTPLLRLLLLLVANERERISNGIVTEIARILGGFDERRRTSAAPLGRACSNGFGLIHNGTIKVIDAYRFSLSEDSRAWKKKEIVK